MQENPVTFLESTDLLPPGLLEAVLNEHAIVSITNAAGTITYVNNKFCEVSGYEPQELIGQNHRIIKSDAHDPEFFHRLWQTIATGKTWQGLIQNQRKDGSPYWVQSTIMPIPGKREKPTGYISIRTDVTERELAKTNYRKFQHVLDLSLDCIFMFDAKSLRFIYVNQGASKQVGYEHDELLEMTPYDIKPDYDEARFIRMLSPLISGQQERLIFETQHEHKSGRRIPVEIFLQFIPEDEGNGRFIAIVRDISDRHRINQALEKLSTADPGQDIFFQLTQALAEALNVPWVGVGHVVNGNTVKVVGFCQDGQRGQDFEYPLAGTPCADVCKTERSLTIASDVVNRYPEDSLLADIGAVSYRGEPLAAPDNHIIGVLWAVDNKSCQDTPTERALLRVASRRAALELQRKQDINRLRQANKELDDLVRALRALSEVNQLIVHAKSEQQLLEDICRVIVEEAGYRMAWVGYKQLNEKKTVKVMAHAGYEQDYLAKLKLTWADTERGRGPTGAAIRGESVVICQDILNDDQFIPWRAQALKQGYASSIALPLSHAGTMLGALNLYAEDAYAFPQSEVRLLNEMANDLAFGVLHLRAEEEKQKLERRLQQAQKMEALGQLTSGIAHDFNNILASIMGYTDLAIHHRDEDADTRKRYLTEVYSAGERARDLIAQMLSFGRGHTELSLTTEAIDPVPVVEETLNMLRSTLPTSLELKLRLLERGKIKVFMDASSIQQIVMNLVINARDAMNNKGQIMIRMAQTTGQFHSECTSCSESFSGSFVEIQVIDQSAGMTEKTMRHIFEPFYTTKDIGKGTGMGLSVVHGSVHQAGGHLLVDSRIGEGTAFRVLLPITEAGDRNKIDQPTLTSASAGQLQNKRVLIVDDEISILDFLREWFESQDANTKTFQDSPTALEHFSKHPEAFDLIITDQTMPMLTGLELYKAIRGIHPDVPVIIMSGYSELIDRQTATQYGLTFLDKPFNTQDLSKMIHKALQQQH